MVSSEQAGEVKNSFNAEGALKKVREARAIRQRRNTWGKSKLSRYQAELVQLLQAGAKYADLQFWLRKEKRVKVARSTILRYLKQVSAGAKTGG